MSAYLNTRVSLYSGRLWQDEALDALVGVPDEAMADTLTRRGLPQLAAGLRRPSLAGSRIRVRWNNASLRKSSTRRGC